VLVCNRGIGSGHPGINAKARVLWTHDLPHTGFIPEPGRIRAFARTVFMSHYAERIWRTMYPDIGKSVFIPNGVDKGLFNFETPKNLDKIIYASHPNRGLKRLPLIFDAIQSRVDFKVTLTAYSNGANMYPNEGNMAADMDSFYCDYGKNSDPNFKIKEPVPQTELAAKLGACGLMIMPTGIPEICSNSILQSLAMGTPIITTGRLGSAHEWVKTGKNGFLTNYMPCDYMTYQMEVVRAAVRVLMNTDFHWKMCQAAARTRILSWQEVGEKWLKMLYKVKK